MTLSNHRQAIDQLDMQIVQLLNERTSRVLEIGKLKLAHGQEIYAPDREHALLKRLIHLNKGPITDDGLRAIYREVMSNAISLQSMLTIAYLGPEATFTHQAAVLRFGSSLLYTPQKTIADVFTEVSKNRASYGVVPVENSTEGVVNSTLDMFMDSDLKIVAQVVMPIVHCLVSRTTRKAITKLYSHPQALGQCRNWVRDHLPKAETIETSSTTRAAVLASKDRHGAAISSALAAERYGLNIVDAGIQDHSSNATRFLVLGRKNGLPTKHDRTSLMFAIADKAGALHAALEPFRLLKLNMTQIESRPSKRKAWEYVFFVDCDGHFEEPRLAKAIGLLQRKCAFVRVLGSYPISE